MVLTYALDVSALPEVHRKRILDLVNLNSPPAISKLDYTYGVLCQDQGTVLGVALVNQVENKHVIEKLCVVHSSRCRGFGTELVDMVKEQIGCCTLEVQVGGNKDLREFFAKRAFVGEDFMTFVDTTLSR